MNWTKLKFLFMDFFIWLAANWWILAAAGVLLLVILIAGQIQSCRSARDEKKIEETKTNITTGKVESNVAQHAINAAANVSNQSLSNVNTVRNTNVSNYSNSYDDARRRYCAEFPRDCR